MIRRREFIAWLGAAAVPRLALAQQGTRMRRLAGLLEQSEDPAIAANSVTFRNELAKLGWVEGRNLQIDVRYGRGDVDRMRANAAELVGRAPDVIVANGPSMVRIAQQQTKTIPIVIAFAGDVLANGLVTNLAHPEGNITGVTNSFATMAGKWVELLKEAVPRVERVGYIYSPITPPPAEAPTRGGVQRLPFLEELEKASRVLALATTAIPFSNAPELVRGIDAFAAEPNGGLVVVGVTGNDRATIDTLAVKYRLPTIYGFRSGIEGGLIVYGARQIDMVVRTASFVDRILRGAKPGDLPVEYPTRFELVVNLKTAKALSLAVPRSILVRADEVIE